MPYVLSVTLPIYLGIALGFVAVRCGWFKPAEIKALGRYTVLIGVPALLFRNISHQSLGAVFHPDYLAVYALGAWMSMAIVVQISRRGLGRSMPVAGLQGLGVSVPNSMFVGFPIAVQVLGPKAGVALALCTLVENLLVLPVGLALADSGSTAGQGGVVRAAWNTLRSVLRNPMMAAILAGLLFSALGLHVPEVLDKPLAMVVGSTSPIALFVIGGSLVGLNLSGLRADIVLIVAGKLLLHPLCVLAWVLLLPPADPVLRGAAVLFAAMPMMGIYPVLAHRYGQEKLCSAALLCATVLSFFTITTVIAVLPTAWLPVH